MKDHGKNKLVIGTGAAALVAGMAAGLAYIITRICVTEALDRNEPKVMTLYKKAMFGNAEFEEETVQRIRAGREKLEGRNLERVEIESIDGLKLVGHWFPAEGTPKRTILAMHGWRSCWSRDFSIINEFWHAEDCNILFAEQRGQGESEGRSMGFGLKERYDVVEWLKWLNENKVGEEPVYLSGISMGASAVMMAAGLPLPENVHGIMADCGFTSPDAIWRHVMEDNLKINYALHRPLISAMVSARIKDEPMDYSCEDALKESKIPLLLVHGEADSFVPVTMSYDNYKACGAEKRMLIVPGAEHGLSYLVDEDAYQKAVLDFWKEFD